MFEGCSPEIEYPCRWHYRIVGTSDEAIRALVAEIVGDLEHDLEPSHVSRKGTYVSLKLSLLVRDEAHRHAVFHALAADESVRHVL